MTNHESRIESGTCSACGAGAERGTSGAWWHTTQRASCGRLGARFQGAERQQHTPRDRQRDDPGRNR